MRDKFSKTYLKKLNIHYKEYEWTDAGGIIMNDLPTILYPLFKIIEPYTRIGVSNLKDEIEKETLATFINNVKYFLDDTSSSYSIIVDKG